MIWALGMWVKSKTSLWVRGAKSLGRQRSWSSWVASNGLSLLPLSLSLSLSLFTRGHDLTLTLSLSVFQKMIFEGKIKTEIILHPTHGQTEKHFQKIYFPYATKHPHLRKSIFRNHFHPIQMQPKCNFNCRERERERESFKKN